MKSPLVDALRLASGQDKAGNNEQSRPAGETAAPHDDVATTEQAVTPGEQAAAEVPELSLMDATGVLVVQSPDDADDADDEFAASQVIPEDAVNEDVAESPLPVAGPAVAVAASNAGRRSPMARLAMLSPLVCLFLASAATGSYFLYQNAGGQMQGGGLGITAPTTGVVNDIGKDLEPDGPVNRFPLVANGRQTRATQRAPQPLPASPRSVPVLNERPAVSRIVRGGVDDRAFAVLNEAYAAYEAGNFEAAAAAYRRALEIAPRHPGALHGLAAILYRTGNVAEALDHYEVLLSVEPNNTEAAAAVLAGRGGSATEIKILLQRYPGSSHLHHTLGNLMAQQGRWADARLAYYKALAIEPQNAEYQFNLAVSLENLGQFADARARYEAALANVTEASAIDSQLVASRISVLAERSASGGTVQ